MGIHYICVLTKEVVSGKLRKYYKAATQGRHMLAEARKKIRELVGESPGRLEDLF